MRAEQLKQIRSKLLTWFNNHKRNLPWRKEPHWYKTYLSEIILQQTTVEQGLPYFKKFIKLYPNIETLARAQEQEILLQWAGLGYYSRARNMLKSAKVIVDSYNGEFPKTYKEALKLPGIGSYSASAILSISFGHSLPVVDGNVTRVISRLYSILDDTRQTRTLKNISSKAAHLLDTSNPGEFNEAIMELGAIICSPKSPECVKCPLNSYCKAYKNGVVEKTPFKSKAAPKHNKFQLSGILKHGTKICIVRRPSAGLLGGMWEFPSLSLDIAQFNNGFRDLFIKEYEINGDLNLTGPNMRHVYSHINLTYKAALFLLSDKKINVRNYQDLKWINFEDINSYAIHNAHKKVFEWFKISDIRN